MNTYLYKRNFKHNPNPLIAPLAKLYRSIDWGYVGQLAFMLLLAVACLGFALIISAGLSHAQTIVPNSFTSTEVCYKKDKYNSSGVWAGFKHTCEKFNAPTVLFETDTPVKYIDASPLDPSRDVFNLPTFALAEFHWWIFDVERERSQQQYAECVGQIKLAQEFLGEYPLIDDPIHPLHARITSVRNYVVPFNPINPRTLDSARANAHAAIGTVNLNVYETGLCKSTLAQYKQRVFIKLQNANKRTR
jgi:hypothetical protein